MADAGSWAISCHRNFSLIGPLERKPQSRHDLTAVTGLWPRACGASGTTARGVVTIRRCTILPRSVFCFVQDLFDEQADVEAMEGAAPLATRMRPRWLEEFVGQEHILAPGKLLRRAIEADRLPSVIFYGPPGSGKTTLARVIAE